MKKKLIVLLSAFTLLLQVQAQTPNEAVNTAIKLTQSERFEDASSAFSKLISADTKGDVYFYAADNFIKWEELDSAKTILNKGVQIYPSNILIHAGLGKLAVYQNNLPEANKEFAKCQELIKLEGKALPKDAQATIYNKMAEGFIYADNKAPDQALNYLVEAEKLNAKDPEIYILRGDALLAKSTGDASASIMNFEKAYELDKSSRRAILRQANLYRQVNNFEEALNYYKQAIALDPNFAPAYRERAELYYRAGRIQSGIEDYKKYLSLNNSPSARGRYASFLYVANDYQNAIVEINSVIAEGNNNPILYRILGYSYYETKNYELGLKNLEIFRSMALKAGKPKFIMLDYSYYGKLLAENGKDSLAIEELKKAINLDPEFTDGYSDIAGIYFKQKNYEEAAKYYQLKVKNTPKPDYNDYNYLGRALYTNKDYAAADSAFIKVAELLPNLTIGYIWSARSKNLLDNPTAPVGLAKEMFEKVIQVGSIDPVKNKKDLVTAYEYLGFLYFVQKNFDCSKAAWLKVQELEPTNEKATAALGDKKISSAGVCTLLPTN